MSIVTCPPTVTQPFCLNFETLRDELIENCGNPVDIRFCCCQERLQFFGTVEEVGADFVRILAPVVQTGTFPADVIIPLRRIVAFFELTDFPPTSFCGTDQLFRDEIAELCGQCLTIFWCDCDHTDITTGVLVEVGADFIELANVVSEEFAGSNLVISLCSICAVEHFLTGPAPTMPCPTPVPTIIPTPTPMPTPTPTPMPTPSPCPTMICGAREVSIQIL